jgi:DNA-binding protein H-NS
MKNINFESLSLEELLDIRDYANSVLQKRIGKERQEIEKTLARLSSLDVGGVRRGRPPGVRKGQKLPPKFRNPETGETWAGRGARPRWLQAMLKKGRKLDEFSVAGMRATRGRKKRSKRGMR